MVGYHSTFSFANSWHFESTHQQKENSTTWDEIYKLVSKLRDEVGLSKIAMVGVC
jgi:hypothetical protein